MGYRGNADRKDTGLCIRLVKQKIKKAPTRVKLRVGVDFFAKVFLLFCPFGYVNNYLLDIGFTCFATVSLIIR